MKNGLTDPVEGFEEDTDKGKEEAGKQPAHDLGVYMMVFPGLPVGIDAQSAEYPRYGSDNKYQV